MIEVSKYNRVLIQTDKFDRHDSRLVHDDDSIMFSDMVADDLLKLGGWTMISYDDFAKRCNDQNTIDFLSDPPEVINAERFEEALNCLPPVRWTGSGDNQFFLMSERYTDDITRAYLKKGDQYLSAFVRTSMTDDQIIQRFNITGD